MNSWTVFSGEEAIQQGLGKCPWSDIMQMMSLSDVSHRLFFHFCMYAHPSAPLWQHYTVFDRYLSMAALIQRFSWSFSWSAVSITSILLVASMEKAERAEYFLQISRLQMYSLRFSLRAQFRYEKAMCILEICLILSFAVWLAFDFHEG